MKKIWRFLLGILIIFIIAVHPLFAKATNISQSSAVAWAQNKIGTGLDYDGAYGNQCVDFIYYYYRFLGVNPVGGNACDYATNSLPAGWLRITSNIVPQPGDIAVWKSYYNDGVYSTGWAGHIGIVINGNSSTFNTIHQNFNCSNAYEATCVQSNNIPTAILACVIRPNFSAASADPTLTWSDYADKHYVGTTNAVLARKCDLNGMSITAVSNVGIYIYDYNDTLLDSFTESVNFGNYSYFTLWYDLNSELGYTLSPGTTYKYKFLAVINGKTYYSPVYTFKTGGTHSHKYNSGTITRNATCTDTGTRIYVCTTCGGTKTETIPTLGHQYSSTWSVDLKATCTMAGSKSKHCTRCNYKGNVTPIAATGHAYGSWKTTINATCTNPGTQKRTCANCSQTQSESVSALGHNYASSWTEDTKATCTQTGSKSHHCTRCDAKADATAIPASGHKWSEWIVTVQPTESNTGLEIRTCKNNCGTQESNVLAKLVPQGHAHTFGEWITITEPTCTEDGVRQKKCTDCGETELQSIAATGHIYGQWEISAAQGLQERICQNCKAVEAISAETTSTDQDNTQPTIDHYTVPTENLTGNQSFFTTYFNWFLIAFCSIIIILAILIIILVASMLIVKFKTKK